ncbi:hypothetical protein Sme01_03270 [Sphaerisporangium melleum]|uniref:Uncharacterized protein n=1 Tax=Sphaerisporangium melleum TaxID=321316 RepID=A0A917QNW5_9ACTN|nr:hypothetical protein [Sphaerisporangium melleum]GGK61526.1 hypothetical protein GCM10007964_00810 [Sphaerisporangium melleum]GII67851.1 hypothetical protein Sme01_03270 [Sphaerisporangium melleum]
MIRLRLARLFRSAADKLDPPGFEYRIDFCQPGEVHDWSKVSDEMR